MACIMFLTFLHFTKFKQNYFDIGKKFLLDNIIIGTLILKFQNSQTFKIGNSIKTATIFGKTKK